MIKSNEAVEMARQFHEEAYHEARTKWVPYWMDRLNEAIISSASKGRGDCRFELRWAERIGACNIPDRLVQDYTERILDEEMARDTGYRVIDRTDGSSTKKYRIVWYSEQFDAYAEDRSCLKNKSESYDFI